MVSIIVSAKGTKLRQLCLHYPPTYDQDFPLFILNRPAFEHSDGLKTNSVIANIYEKVLS